MWKRFLALSVLGTLILVTRAPAAVAAPSCETRPEALVVAGHPNSTGIAKCRKDPGAATLALLAAAAIPLEYLLVTTVHEGAHVMAGMTMGRKVEEFKPYPFYIRYPDGQKKLMWGYTLTSGPDMTAGQNAAFLLAPKAANLLVLGGYSALLETDSLPENKFGQVALAGLATATWVDFSWDLFSPSDRADVTRTYEALGAVEGRSRLPYQLIHGALSVAAGIEVGRGIYKLFKPSKASCTPPKYGSPIIGPAYVGWGGVF